MTSEKSPRPRQSAREKGLEESWLSEIAAEWRETQFSSLYLIKLFPCRLKPPKRAFPFSRPLRGAGVAVAQQLMKERASLQRGQDVHQ